MNLSLILDAIIAVLLVTTIGYAVVLNRRLGAFRGARSEMEALVARFARFTDEAGSGINSLKDETRRSGKTLQDNLNAARGLADDLAFLIERGSSLAERLDGAIGKTRAAPAAGRASAPARGARPPAEQGSCTPAGTEIKPDAAARKPAGAESQPGGTASKPDGTASIHASSGKSAPSPGAEDLSAQESVLLKALQGMR